MTTALSPTKLGDFVQAFVGPKEAALIWSGQDGIQLTLANQDLVNGVTIARRPNFTQNGSNTAVVPALGSITVDGSRSIWALAPANTAPLLIFPGGGNWAPSPAQVAAQINALGLAKDTSVQQVNTTLGVPAQTGDVTDVKNAVNAPGYGPITTVNPGTLATDVTLSNDSSRIYATGVPLVNKSVVVRSVANQAVSAGATFTDNIVSCLAPTFEVYLVLNNANAADTAPIVHFVMNWIDSSSGTQIYTGHYHFVPGCGGGVLAQYHGIGVTHADQLQIQIQNGGSSAGTYSWFILQNGKPNPISNELWTQLNNFTYPSALFPLGGVDPNGNILLNTSAAAGAGTILSRMMTPYYGRPIQLQFHTGSGLSDAIVTVETPAALAGAGPWNSVWVSRANANATGDLFMQVTTPFYPLAIRMQNNNGSSRTFDICVTGI